MPISSTPTRKVSIIGAGLVGLATAIKLKEACPNFEITVWEKEWDAGQHQSTHNSGVLHAGLYYKPGSLKARLAVEGIRAMTAFCVEHGIPHDICGKVVVASDAGEASRLDGLFERGLANGLKGIRKLSLGELKELEPMAEGVAAIHVPEEGIVDYRAVVAAMKGVLECQGTVLRLSEGVQSMRFASDKWHVATSSDSYECDFIINCAGLQSDRVARLAGEIPATRIVPFRGEYFCLKADLGARLRKLIYPVPDPVFPFLGVHLTRLIHGGVEAGPNAVLALAREGYKKWSVNLQDMFEALGFSGLWKFMAAHPRMCLHEVSCSLSKKLFCKALQKLVPSIQESDLLPGGVGVRAQAMTANGQLVQDFDFIERANALHVLNAPSPGATASLAIGGHIAAKVSSLIASN